MFAQPPPHRRANHRLLAARVKAKEQLDRLPLGGSVGPIGSLLAVGMHDISCNELPFIITSRSLLSEQGFLPM